MEDVIVLNSLLSIWLDVLSLFQSSIQLQSSRFKCHGICIEKRALHQNVRNGEINVKATVLLVQDAAAHLSQESSIITRVSNKTISKEKGLLRGLV